VPVVLEVEELIVPLGDNPQGIFDECAHDQETAHGWDVSTELTPVSTSPSTTVTEPHSLALQPSIFIIAQGLRKHIRFYRIGRVIQPLFDLVRLLPDLLQRAGVIGGICASWTAEPVLGSEVVARGPTYLGHLLLAHARRKDREINCVGCCDMGFGRRAMYESGCGGAICSSHCLGSCLLGGINKVK